MQNIFSENPNPVEVIKYYLEHSEFLKTIEKVKIGIHPPDNLRQLSANEISKLVMNNNISANWDKITVTKDFIVDNIINNQFLGEAVIGRLDSKVTVDGRSMNSKILNSTIYDAQIGNGSLIQNVQMVSDVAIMDHAVIMNCLTVSHGNDLHFGVGKELSLAVETGGREVRVFPEITIDVARIICRDRGNKELLNEYNKLVDEYMNRSASKWSIVGKHAQILDSPKILNFYMGEYALIDNACSVKNCVMISGEGESSIISNGAIVKDCTMQWGAEITTGAITEGSIFTEYSGANRQGKVFDSLIGSNSNIAEGEVTASLVGSFVGFHHQALLISAYWPGGKGNIAYGANVGSNHTGKEPDQELWPGEGMFFGLDCAIKYPSDYTGSPYSIIATGVSALPQKVAFPFSLFNPPAANFDKISPAFNEIFPAWVLSDNIFMIKRNEGKYKKRNKAKRIYIKFDIFRPSIVNKMITALERLSEASGKKIYTERDISGLGKNYISEINRLKAIETYTKFINYYALRELFKIIGTEKLPENFNVFMATDSKDETWEHARNLYGLFNIAGSFKEAGEKLIEINNEIANQVFESKKKDDIRGEKITLGYLEAHVSAENNSFVKETLEETEKENNLIENLLKNG